MVIAAHGAEKLEEAAAELRRSGGEVLAVAADITQQADVDALVAKTIERFGRLDALVNNAGRSARGTAIDTSAEEFAELMNLNLVALVRVTRAAMPHLLAARGHLVNIGSLAGKTAAAYMGAYSATKYAVSAYSQQLRLELGPQGLHVLLVSPGPIARDEPRQYEGENKASLPARHQTGGGREGQPAEQRHARRANRYGLRAAQARAGRARQSAARVRHLTALAQSGRLDRAQDDVTGGELLSGRRNGAIESVLECGSSATATPLDSAQP